MNDSFYIRSIKINPNVNKDETYISTLPIVKNFLRLKEINFNSPVTFFIGENGTGKSTLLEAIAVLYGFNAEGGSINFNFSTYKSHSNLHNYIRLSKGIKRAKDGFFLRAESFYNVASNIQGLDEEECGGPLLIDSYGGVSLHEKSHGESFMALVENRFWGNGLYILDEPEAALSPTRQLMLLKHINDLIKNNSQFIISSHSPILLSFPGAEIYSLTEDEIQLTSYEETEHYTLTRDFLNNPTRMLKYLFED